MTEAVIQFRYTLRSPDPDAPAAAAMLRPVFRAAQQLGVMGREADRYEGLAFGNLSYGSGDGQGFWITATQTADIDHLRAEHVVKIVRWDLADNAVLARGSLPPSSEALSHAAIHGCRSHRPTWVLHGHAPAIWHRAGTLGWPVTAPTAANGTLALAEAVAELADDGAGLIVMGGHEDGVLAYGGDGAATLASFAKALADARKPPFEPEGQPHAHPSQRH